MNTSKENNNSNRRRAFRVYEQVNLLFHQIEYIDDRPDNNSSISIADHISHSLATKNAPEKSLPDSYSQENDSLNVNISSTGISFTCKEKLHAGDYLCIRLFLLSSMTMIMTCCRVVYIKPSNPFEKNRYPNQVGAEFVNLQSEDQDLLDKYINKKKKQRLLINVCLTALIMTTLLMPDTVYEMVSGLCSFLFDNVLELLHLLYEIFEFGIDHLIESVFHMGLQATQTISFYTQLILALAIAYPAIRICYSIVKKLLFSSRKFYCRKKSSLLYYWGEQSFFYKVGVIFSGIMAITCYLLFFI